MKMKRITSPYYTFEKIGIDYFGRNTKLPNECLYSKGMYATKITESDLPEWYVDGIIYKRYGFLSTKGVKQMVYKPRYMNHLYRDDCLYVSFADEPVIEMDKHGYYEGYDLVVSGHMILRFIEAAKKYSNYDISELETALKEKEKWYAEKYPEWYKEGIV